MTALNSKTIVELWKGSKFDSGTLTLNDYITNYDIIVVITQTNTQYFADYIFEGVGTIGNLSIDHVDADGGYRSDTQYNLYDNKAYIFVRTNNNNWKLGVVRIYGIKLAAK